jgi:hypothetical protein
MQYNQNNPSSGKIANNQQTEMSFNQFNTGNFQQPLQINQDIPRNLSPFNNFDFQQGHPRKYLTHAIYLFI